MNKAMRVVTSFLDREFWAYYLLICIATAALVLSGFDWWYLVFVTKNIPMYLLFISDMLGFVFPFVLIIGLFIYNRNRKQEFVEKMKSNYFFTIVLAFCSSTFIKLFAGRESPPHEHGFTKIMFDNSHNFQFGFLREQVVGGFPSSHTAIAFSLAFTTLYLFPENRKIQIIAFVLALFVGIGVTFGFHWFSEFFAGTILGFIVAKVVKKNYN